MTAPAEHAISTRTRRVPVASGSETSGISTASVADERARRLRIEFWTCREKRQLLLREFEFSATTKSKSSLSGKNRDRSALISLDRRDHHDPRLSRVVHNSADAQAPRLAAVFGSSRAHSAFAHPPSAFTVRARAMSMFGSFGNLFGASGPQLCADIGEPYAKSFGGWTHHRGTIKEDGTACSVFKFVGNAQSDRRSIETARNGAKRLKLTRHPNVVHLRESLEVEKGDEITIYVVTEAVQPLEEHLRSVPSGTHQRDEYFALGIRQVATAVSFLANDCKLVHGGVCMAAVFVTERLDWKLGHLDLLSDLQNVGRGTMGDARICHSGYVIPDQYKPEEYRRGDWASVPEGPPWAIDAWGLGCLIQEVYRGEPLGRTDQLREIDHVPQVLLKDYQRLLGSQPAKRYNPKKLVENSSLFANKLVETIAFLDTLTLKDSIEKEQFFRHLPRVLETLAKAPVERKILPQIAEALEFGSAPALAVAPMLHAARDLPDADFAKKVTPSLVKLFASSDKALRVALLEHLPLYVRHLSDKIVDETLYERAATGFTDEDAFLRELTLKSTLSLAPKMSQRAHQSLLKHLSKLQIDEEPAIRANTTILLGNIAGYLSEATAKRVLLNAFTRALRDAFPPARTAGLMELGATTSYYEPNEIANRVLPAVTPLVGDVEKDVRDRAFATAETFLDLMKKHSKRLEQGPEAAAAALAADKELARQKERAAARAGGAAAGTRDGAPGAGNVLSWAVNAAARRIGRGSMDIAAGGGGGGGRAGHVEEEAAARGVDMGAKAFSSAAPPPRLYGEAYTPTGTPGVSPAPSPAKGFETAAESSRFSATAPADAPVPADDDGDGWGDLEEEEDEAEKAARARLASRGREASRTAGGSSRAAATAAPPDASGGDGWGDDDDDLFGDRRDDGFGSKPSGSGPSAPVAAQRATAARVGGHVSVGGARGAGARGVAGTRAKPAPMKLGAKKITAADLDLESMLNQ